MRISLIVCTKDRAGQLEIALARLKQLQLVDIDLELVLVDNGSTDDTTIVAEAFCREAPFDVRFCFEPIAGLGAARNCGIRHATGELLVFTDDDCYLAEDYFQVLRASLRLGDHGYGGGQILAVHPEDDERVARLEFSDLRIIEPASYFLPPGLIQGANLFFFRHVFEAIGMFRPDMGAGTPFPCEDIEMVCRASNAGFGGILIPELKVFHDHGRRRNSSEALRVIESYDNGRGAYYASLLCEGRVDVLQLWLHRYLALPMLNRDQLMRLAREFRSAADFLEAQHFAADHVQVVRRMQ